MEYIKHRKYPYQASDIQAGTPQLTTTVLSRRDYPIPSTWPHIFLSHPIRVCYPFPSHPIPSHQQPILFSIPSQSFPVPSHQGLRPVPISSHPISSRYYFPSHPIPVLSRPVPSGPAARSHLIPSHQQPILFPIPFHPTTCLKSSSPSHRKTTIKR